MLYCVRRPKGGGMRSYQRAIIGVKATGRISLAEARNAARYAAREVLRLKGLGRTRQTGPNILLGGRSKSLGRVFLGHFGAATSSPPRKEKVAGRRTSVKAAARNGSRFSKATGSSAKRLKAKKSAKHAAGRKK